MGTNYKGSAIPDWKIWKDSPHSHKVRRSDENPAYTRLKWPIDCMERETEAKAHLN